MLPPPSLAAFPDAPPSLNTPQMLELQRANRAEYDTIAADTRAKQTAYNRDFGAFDDETIAAVDKFRADKDLVYQGNAPGLVDARFIDALRRTYFEKLKHTR